MGRKLSYCGEMVRRYDPDRFLLSLFVPPDRRESLWALYAFNHEIAKTREVVTETQLGLIRLQWWRDALTGIFEKDIVLEHEVLKPLAEAIKAYDLPQNLFEDLIYGREFDLEDRSPVGMEGVCNYADFTTTPLVKLSLLITGGQEQDDVVQAVAKAYALTGLLRAVPYHFSQRRCYLPADMIPPVTTLFEGRELDKTMPAIQEIVAEADRLLAVKPQDPYLRRMAKLARLYLKQIKRAEYDVFSPRLQVPPLLREVRLLVA